MCGQISKVTRTSAAPAALAKRVASSSNVSAEPTWISNGGKPVRFAYRGETRGSFLSVPGGRYASASSFRYSLWMIGSTASLLANVEPDIVNSVHGDTRRAPGGQSPCPYRHGPSQASARPAQPHTR